MPGIDPLSHAYVVEVARGEGLEGKITELKAKAEVLELYEGEIEKVYDLVPSSALAELLEATKQRRRATVLQWGQTHNAFVEHYRRMYGEYPPDCEGPIDLADLEE